MNKTLFYLKTFFVDFVIDGFKSLIDGIKATLRKPDNYILLSMIYVLIVTTLYIFPGRRPVSIWFVILTTILYICTTFWRFIFTGELKDRWKDKKLKELNKIEEKTLKML